MPLKKEKTVIFSKKIIDNLTDPVKTAIHSSGVMVLDEPLKKSAALKNAAWKYFDVVAAAPDGSSKCFALLHGMELLVESLSIAASKVPGNLLYATKEVVMAILGASEVRDFSIAMIIGVVVGTYSTIAVACPFVVWWDNRRIKAPAKA